MSNGNEGYLGGAGPYPVPPEVFPDDLQKQQAPEQGGELKSGAGASPAGGTPREEGDSENRTTLGGGEGGASGVIPAADAAAEGGSEPEGPKAVSEMNKEELEAELGDEVGNVKGSGANGNVVVEDLRKAVSEQRSESE